MRWRGRGWLNPVPAVGGRSADADVREHGPDSLDLGRGHRSVVAELVQAVQLGERWHGGGEAEHRGGQAFSLYVQVPQLRQAAQLPQSVLGVG
jgi:hypothetical protein